MALVIKAVEHALAPAIARKKHDLLPSPTVSIGYIHGGVKPNIVPESCIMQLDRRTLPGEEPDEVLREVQEAVGNSLADWDSRSKLGIRQLMHVEAAEIGADTTIVQECMNAYERVNGVRPGIGCTAGFEDAHFFINECNIPCAMFGPYWCGEDPEEMVHPSGYSPVSSGRENVNVASVVSASRVYAELAEKLLGMES
jgi:acetylornithine deacetylase/succinyl-diaminopimelate desuccinylase-like protein